MPRSKDRTVFLFDQGHSYRPVEISELREKFYDVEFEDNEGQKHMMRNLYFGMLNQYIKTIKMMHHPKTIIFSRLRFLIESEPNLLYSFNYSLLTTRSRN